MFLSKMKNTVFRINHKAIADKDNIMRTNHKCLLCHHTREFHICDKHGQSYCLKCTCNGFTE